MQTTIQNPLLLSQELATIAEQLRCCTVQVKSGRRGAGSGVIWTSQGLIITNSHVVYRDQAEVELADGRVLTAQVTLRNTARDLAALQVAATDLPAATLGDSNHLRVGELVLAVGNPLGLVGALTTGIVHTIGATDHQPWIQADVRLAPGNSGGALANAQGQVIGINTMIVNDRGFAVPSHVVQQFLNHWQQRPYLGVSLQPVMVPLNNRPVYGLLILAVESGSPAEAASLQTGDVLIGVRGTSFQTPNELFQILERSQAGDGLPLNFLRSGQRRIAEVILCHRDAAAEAL